MNRKAHWENVYTDKSPLEVSWYQQEPTLSLSLIHETKIDKDAAIIDVGGGASLLVDRLFNEGYQHLSVLDISGRALNHARERLGVNAEKVEWYEEDVTAFRAPHPYILWHDRAVFHFLNDEADRRRYVAALEQAVPSGGHIIIAAFAIGGPEKCSGLDIVQYDSAKLVNVLGGEFRLLEEQVEIHLTPSKAEQKFVYFHLVRS